MSWNSLADFISMGGRGGYVWGTYGVALLLMAVELWLLVQRHRQGAKRLYRIQQLEKKTDE